mmetsp:Transcript_13483/g.16090  ORF Transcript_13483/g.16090 Transcript_13483/m.16090 type:complete len:249 (-) Transcript_13483:919-1665(-)
MNYSPSIPNYCFHHRVPSSPLLFFLCQAVQPAATHPTPARSLLLLLLLLLLYVDGLVVGGHHRLLHCFRESRVCMARAREVLRRCSVFQANHSLHDHFAGVRPEHVDAEKAVGFFVSKDFHHPISIIYCACTAVRHEREHPLVVLDASLLELLLGLSNCSKLWMGVNNAWNCIIIHVSSKASHVLDSSDTFFLSLVGEHGSLNAIANGIDVWYTRLQMVVRLDHPAVHFDANAIKPKPIEVRYTADCN